MPAWLSVVTRSTPSRRHEGTYIGRRLHTKRHRVRLDSITLRLIILEERRYYLNVGTAALPYVFCERAKSGMRIYDLIRY